MDASCAAHHVLGTRRTQAPSFIFHGHIIVPDIVFVMQWLHCVKSPYFVFTTLQCLQASIYSYHLAYIQNFQLPPVMDKSYILAFNLSWNQNSIVDGNIYSKLPRLKFALIIYVPSQEFPFLWATFWNSRTPVLWLRHNTEFDGWELESGLRPMFRHSTTTYFSGSVEPPTVIDSNVNFCGSRYQLFQYPLHLTSESWSCNPELNGSYHFNLMVRTTACSPLHLFIFCSAEQQKFSGQGH